jgi:hypothetical protein
MSKKIMLLLVLLIFALPQTARAQFIGYESPQSSYQTLANNVNCTGSAQNFPVSNLGQTQHYASAVAGGSIQTFKMEIDGIDRLGFIYRISDVESLGSNVATNLGSVAGSGAYPVVQVSVTCSPNTAVFTVSYSGASATSNINAGSFLLSQIDKISFSAIPATVSKNDFQYQTPFGNSAGTLYALFNGAASTGATISVVCNSSGISAATAQYSFPLAANLSVQSFQVPASECAFAQLQYTGAAGGSTFSAEMIYSTPGNPLLADPCAAPGITKSSAVISAPATATTQIVALSANAAIYVCGFQGSQSVAGAFQWEYGTGASCGTGTTAVSGVETTLSGTPVLDGDAGMTIFKAPPGNAVCIVTSIAGTFNGKLTFVQR